MSSTLQAYISLLPNFPRKLVTLQDISQHNEVISPNLFVSVQIISLRSLQFSSSPANEINSSSLALAFFSI